MKDIEDLGKVFRRQHSIIVNGVPREVKVDPSTSLANWLRESCHLTGTKIGCGSNACGACTVMVSYREGTDVRHVSVNSCSTPVGPLVNLHVTTSEADDQLLKDIQRRFACGHASQCGFCTPGFTCKVSGILRQKPEVDLATAQKELDGNLCRCTGYRPILSAVNSLFQPAKLPHTNGDLVVTPALGLTDFQPLDTLPPFAFENCLQEPSNTLMESGGSQFFRPSSLDSLFQVLDAKPGAILVGGLTGIHTQPGQTYISTAYVPELRRISSEKGALALGSAVTFQETVDFLIKHPDEEKFSLFSALQQMLQDVGSSAIRSSATWGGCVALNEDNSDVLCFLSVVEATIDVRSPSGTRPLNVEMLPKSLPHTDLVLAVRIPAAQPNTLYLSLKSRPRPDFSRPVVGGTFAVTLDTASQPQRVCTSMVGLSLPRAYHCFDASQLRNGHSISWSDSGPTLHELSRQFFYPLIDKNPHPVFSASYRKDLADALMLDFVAFTSLTRTPLQWKPMIDSMQSFQLLQSEEPVGQPVPLSTAFLQASGGAEFTDDEAAKAHALFSAPILSQRSHARFKIDDAAARLLPGVLAFYYARDAKGDIHSEAAGPLMASEETMFFGQVLGLVVATDYDSAQRAAYAVKVTYEDLPAVSTIEQAIAEGSFHRTDFAGPFEQGDVDQAFAECDAVVEGVVNLAAAEHWYLEPHSSLAVPRESGTEVSLLASTQHQGSLFGQVGALTGLPHARIHVRTARLGGGFGV
jgi:xanthine dehydrogenase/oxidase